MLQFELSDLFSNSVNYLLSCQSWDGGFGPSPGAESHGGYTYTSLAALTMIGGIKQIRYGIKISRKNLLGSLGEKLFKKLFGICTYFEA